MDQKQRQKFEFNNNFSGDEALLMSSSYTDTFTPYHIVAPLGVVQESLEPSSNIDLDRLIQDAYAQGFQEGRVYGGDSEHGHVGHFVKNFEAAFHRYEESFHAIQRNVTQAVTGIITQVIRTIMQGVPLELFADRLKKQLHKIHMTLPKAELVVKGHPACIDIAQKHISTSDFAKQITFQSDDTLPKTDCLIEWPGGGVDVRFDQYIDNVIAYLINPDTVTQLLDNINTNTQQNTGEHHE